MTLSNWLLVLPVLALQSAGDANPEFDRHFTGRTLRFDYFHSGTAHEEHISVDGLRLEGEWPGRRRRLLDDTNLGKYLFRVVDAATNLPLYSQGFASIYGEWETTGEARTGVWRTLHESQRLPEPRRPVQLVIDKRAVDGSFRQLFAVVVDPASRDVNRAPLVPAGRVWSLFEHGPPAGQVDLLVLGDGYTTEQLAKYRADVERLMSALFATPPFAQHRQRFNVWGIDVAAVEPGVSDPRAGAWRSSPLGLSYNAFDSERYVLTFANRQLREIAALAPYDALVLIANHRKYGGGGIFNLWTTAAADSAEAAYLVVHELGHSFAGLADEYYTSQVAYEEMTPAGSEPWEPNITALLDPARLKWRQLAAPATPIPTPWEQARYDQVALAFQDRRQALRAAGAAEEAVEDLFAEVKSVTSELLGREQYFGEVGAFAGAGYQAQGLYRGAVDCIMFTRNPASFCPVCSHAVERAIAHFTGSD